MGKTSKWLKGFLTGKKEKDKDREKENHKTTLRTTTTTLPSETRPPSESTPASKEKRRWSFRRSAATTAAAGKDPNSPPYVRANTQLHGLEAELDQKRHAMAVAVATAAAADAAVAAAQAAAAVFRLASEVHGGSSAMEEAAAIKIQSAFRSYLARKALCALKGLVTLQALVRGHLVRKQATATLRSMQALVTAQARARAERIRMLEEAQSANPPRHSISTLRRSPQHPRFRHSFFEEKDKLTSEENIKIVEMDRAETKSISKTSRRSSYSATITQSERKDHHRLSDYYYYYYYDPSAPPPPPPPPPPNQVSPSPSALTDVSPRACYSATSAQLDGDFFFATAQSSPQYCSAVSAPVQDVAQVKPNYMANTESWRAKARSQSAPRPRPEKRRRGGRAVGVMQRSASNVSGYGYQWPPWAAPVRLDRSCASVREGSECGSTSTVLTGAGYCRSLAAFEVHGNRY